MAEKKRAKRAAGFIVQYSLQVQCTAGARGAERREAAAAASTMFVCTWGRKWAVT